MDQPWWVYALIAAGCLVSYLLVKIVESKYIKEDEDLAFLNFVLGFIGFFAAYKAAEVLNMFS